MYRESSEDWSETKWIKTYQDYKEWMERFYYSGNVRVFDYDGEYLLIYKSDVQRIEYETPVETYYNESLPLTYGKTPMEHMGVGWSLKFDRIVIDGDDSKYLKLADGSTYKYDKSTYSNLKGYTLKDIRLEDDTTSSVFAGSKYVLKHINGTNKYFNADGHILGIRDKFNNKITFKYNASSISIVDTLNQTTTITYSSTQVSILLPDGASTIYKITKKGNYEVMSSKTDPLLRSTAYAYTQQTGNMDYTSKTFANSPKSVTYNNLTSVTHPTGAVTSYGYAKTTGNLGEKGVYEYYRVTSRRDYDGQKYYNTETYSYPSSNNFTGYPLANSSDNLASTFKYTVEVTDQNGNKTLTTFNNKHLTESVTLTNGTLRSRSDYVYNSNKLPTSVKNTVYNKLTTATKIENTELFEYDDYANLIYYWSPLANGVKTDKYKTSYTYNNTSPFGTTYNMLLTKTYQQNDAGKMIKEDYTLTSDKKSVQYARVYEDNVLKAQTYFSSYDSYGNVTQERKHIDSSQYITVDYVYLKNAFVSKKTTNASNENVIEEFTYDTIGRLKTSKDGRGNITEYTYDKLGRVTETKYPSEKTQKPTVTNLYNDSLNTLTVTNETGTQTKYTYDKLGNIVSVLDIITGNEISYEYDTSMRVSKEKDAMGMVTAYSYDYLDRILSKTVGDNLYKESYEYDDAYTADSSRVVKIIEGDNDAPTIKTASYTDRYGRDVKQTQFEGTAVNAPEHTLVTNEFDYLGNVIKSTNALNQSTFSEYNYAGAVIKLTNTDGTFFTTSYDFLGRKTGVTDPKNNTTTYIYNAFGQVLEENIPFVNNAYTIKRYQYDKNGNVLRQEISNNLQSSGTVTYSKTEYGYDTMNRLLNVSAFDNGIVENYTKYVYDDAGNKLEMHIMKNPTDTAPLITKYEYNHLSQLTKVTDPLGQSEFYNEYDKNGNLKIKTDKNGTVITNTYDVFNRLTKVSANSSSGETKTLEYAYSKSGAKTMEKNENLETTYKYNNLGMLYEQTESNGIVKTYTYDLLGNRKSFVLKQNGAFKTNQSYDYDQMNRLWKTYENGLSTPVATYTYDANGNRETLEYPNGIKTTYAYNKANLVTSLENKKGNEAPLSKFTYTYYLDGNQASKTDTSGRTTTYIYDGLGRLKTEEEKLNGTLEYKKVYTFDFAGNRKKMEVSGKETYTTEYNYDDNNRLTKETKSDLFTEKVSEYNYDLNGNQISKTTYNLRNTPTGNSAFGLYIVGTYRPIVNKVDTKKNQEERKASSFSTGESILLAECGRRLL